MQKRLDVALVERGLAESRTQAQKMIHDGRVRWYQGQQVSIPTKASIKVLSEDKIVVDTDVTQDFVSRAGLKLNGALDELRLELEDKIVLDVGQSTGGFSDCVLRRGCRRVVGVDVGRDQLHTSIKSDSRVRFYEGLNARYLEPEQLDPVDRGPFDLVVMDVSFISQTLILPQLFPFLAEGGQVLSLVKPQFEVGKDGIAKGGLVKDSSLYVGVQEKILECLVANGLKASSYFESCIAGGDGNREFFVLASLMDS